MSAEPVYASPEQLAAAAYGMPFSQLVGRFSPKILGMSAKMLRSYHDAEDATQDILMKLLNKAGSFDGSYQLEPWISKVTKNYCIDLIRARRYDVLRRSRQVEPWDSVGEIDEGSLRYAKLSKLIRSVKKDKRRMIGLMLKDMTQQEMAEYTGLPIGTVKSRLSREIDNARRIASARSKRARNLRSPRSR